MFRIWDNFFYYDDLVNCETSHNADKQNPKSDLSLEMEGKDYWEVSHEHWLFVAHKPYVCLYVHHKVLIWKQVAVKDLKDISR